MLKLTVHLLKICGMASSIHDSEELPCITQIIFFSGWAKGKVSTYFQMQD